MERADPLDSLPEAAALASALPGPFRRAIRLHPRRGTPVGWGDLHPVPWHDHGRFHDPAIDPSSRLDYHGGLAYPQDAASQVPVLLLDPRPGETIVDACAAPGSKTTQIGLALGDDGLVVACDASAPRRAILAETLARQGITSAVVTPLPLERLADRAPGVADGVLVDAPCSGHERRSARQVLRQQGRQLAILRTAARLVRPGGRLVYSTCTPYRGEDEDVIAAFLAETAGWSVEATALPGCDGDLAGLGALRLWPHHQGTEPFFAARLRAPDDGGASHAWAGRLPPAFATGLAAVAGLQVWRHGDLVLGASSLAAACALPADARGIILGRIQGERLVWEPWGAQACIERGALARVVERGEALRLWAGEDVADVQGFVRCDSGLPLGWAQGGRLRMPARMTRSVLG